MNYNDFLLASFSEKLSLLINKWGLAISTEVVIVAVVLLHNLFFCIVFVSLQKNKALFVTGDFQVFLKVILSAMVKTILSILG